MVELPIPLGVNLNIHGQEPGAILAGKNFRRSFHQATDNTAETVWGIGVDKRLHRSICSGDKRVTSLGTLPQSQPTHYFHHARHLQTRSRQVLYIDQRHLRWPSARSQCAQRCGQWPKNSRSFHLPTNIMMKRYHITSPST